MSNPFRTILICHCAFKTQDLKKPGNIRKISKYVEDRVQLPVSLPEIRLWLQQLKTTQKQMSKLLNSVKFRMILRDFFTLCDQVFPRFGGYIQESLWNEIHNDQKPRIFHFSCFSNKVTKICMPSSRKTIIVSPNEDGSDDF